jgi:elongation factor Ts
MATITAKDVNKLRQHTGAGMMDCKKALVEADGDFDKAVDLLRQRGQKIAAKRADRETSEGRVFAHVNEAGDHGIAFAFACETEPVSNTDDFKNLGESILKAAVEANAGNKEAVLGLDVDGTTAGERITELSGRIGEKIEISDFANVTGEAVVNYNHGSKIAVLVTLENTGSADVTDAGRDVAMQIAAMNPIAVDETSVDAETVERERNIGVEKAKEEGKPANIAEKIAEGYVKKYLKENTLVNQPFVKDAGQTVAQYVDSVQKGMKVKSFNRVSVK